MIPQALAGCAPERAIDAAGLLMDLAETHEDLVATSVAAMAERRRVAIGTTGRRYEGDLYGEATAAQGAIVLVPGLAPAGRDDPRLLAVAVSLRRAGFTVLVPDLPEFSQQIVRPENAREIADAAAWLAGRGDTPGKVGIVAVSYAVGPAILAALEPEVRDRIGFVLAIGGYHDLTDVVRFFTTGHYRVCATCRWRVRQPNRFGKWVFVKSNLHRVDSAEDRRLLGAIARRKLIDLDADVSGAAAALGAEGRAVYDAVTNTDPDAVEALLTGLPDGIRRNLRDLDLGARDLGGLRADVILIHGRDDAIIPWTESAALADALPQGRAHLHLLDTMAHADFRAAGAGDMIELWQAAYRLLGHRP